MSDDNGELWYVLVCRVCSPNLNLPIPFKSAEDRGKWAAVHTRGTGHNSWLVIDQPKDPNTELPWITKLEVAANSSNFDDVGEFHRKFDLEYVREAHPDHDASPRPVSQELFEFRRDFMREELDEFIEAWETGDVVKQFDSLLDLAYVVFGTAHVFGFPWEEGWSEVQRANMTKTRATTGMVGPRGNAEFDVIKPPGWQPPRIAEVLKRHGWTEAVDEPRAVVDDELDSTS